VERVAGRVGQALLRQRGREEGDLENMEQVVRRMDADGREQATLEYIRNLMESLNLTVEEAMDALKVPLDEREALKAKL
jgi:predicted transposase YdaD